jgi:hypothetical protein
MDGGRSKPCAGGVNMDVKPQLSCPLGSKCEEIKDNTMYRCAWFINLAGTNPNTGETIDERGCAMAWIPVLLIENSAQQRSTAAAVESFRNEVVATATKPVLVPNYANGNLRALDHNT